MNNPTNQDQVKKKIHTFCFTPGERMVFYRWKNKYQPTEDYQNLFNSPWCPLFGVLPFNDPPVSTAKSLIQRLRTFFGIPSHLTELNLCPEAYPDPKVIFELTGFSQTKLSLARTLFKKFIDGQEFPDDEINNYNLVNMSPLIQICCVWIILRHYYEDRPTQSKDKLFQENLLRVKKKISDNGEKYVKRHMEIEAEEKRLESRQKAHEFQSARTDRSREGKLKAKESRKEKVKKSFDKLFRGSNINFSTENRIAKGILEDLKQNNVIISLNTVKSHLRELQGEGDICLPHKKAS